MRKLPAVPTLPVADIVDFEALGKTVGAALIAGLGVALIFSLTILAFTKAQESRADEARARAAVFGFLTAFGVLAFLGFVTLGLIVMTDE